MSFLDRRHEELQAQFDRISDPACDRVEALGHLTQQLAAHISIEQSFVVPLLKGKGIADRRLIRRLNGEYRRMGRLLGLIERRKANSSDQPALVTDLQDAYQRHVRRFQLYVEPRLRDRASADELRELSDKMDSAQATILSHPHAHMLSLGPLSRFTTRMAAGVGRRRGESPPPTGLWRPRK